MPTKQRLAEIALNLAVCAVAAGLIYTGLTWRRARRHKTRWHICLVRLDEVWTGLPVIYRSEFVWESSLPDEEAINHLPMIGSRWGDEYMVETVYSERVR